MTERKSFTKEFKLEAIRLLETTDKTGTALARKGMLGVKPYNLHLEYLSCQKTPLFRLKTTIS